MKMELWRTFSGNLYTSRKFSDDTLLGTIEVTEPKKVVTKEVKGWSDPSQLQWVVTSVNERGSVVPIPPNAKNIRILYDVEE